MSTEGSELAVPAPLRSANAVSRHGVHPLETTKRHTQTQGCLEYRSGGGGGADGESLLARQ